MKIEFYDLATGKVVENGLYALNSKNIVIAIEGNEYMGHYIYDAKNIGWRVVQESDGEKNEN